MEKIMIQGMKQLVMGLWMVLLAVGQAGVAGFVNDNSTAAGVGRIDIELGGPGWRMFHDDAATWTNDELFLPPVGLAKIPVNEPVGGWERLTDKTGTVVSVPGTVEEYLSKGGGTNDDITGVSWWWRTITIPEAASPKRVIIRFESARLRSEVYINRKLVAYDVIGGTPFEADITDAVSFGQKAQIAVRITDPGGRFDWDDNNPDVIKWGAYGIPQSHGFGGITGRVRLLVCDPVYVDDLYMQNTPAVREANAIVTVRNTTAVAVNRNLAISIREAKSGKQVLSTEQKVEFKPGQNSVTMKLAVPAAALWSPAEPNLYACEAELKEGGTALDADSRRFGFRWFNTDGIGTNALLRLNGQRIFLLSAIGFGFWPINGIYPTPELAEREIRIAKELGMNMLTFHRTIGHPIVLQKADELGLLFYQEPGGFAEKSADPFTQAACREKVLRMVKRDRSHPSLVIYNMMNERWAPSDGAIFQVHKEIMKAAHELDPSRHFLYASHNTGGTKEEIGREAHRKLNMRPFDDVQHLSGWYDKHNALAPGVWSTTFYRGPREGNYWYLNNPFEVLYWGEDGPMSSPPRFELIRDELQKAPHGGWMGRNYLAWAQDLDSFYSKKNLKRAFESADRFCVELGNAAFRHQKRRIELARAADVGDGYVINAWEGEMTDQHSGIVDVNRFPKGDPAIIASAMRPLSVAVAVRHPDQIVELPGKAVADFYVINEVNLRGAYTVRVVMSDPAGKRLLERTFPVTLRGGDVFSELAGEAVELPLAGRCGMYPVEASLMAGAGKTIATGRDEILGLEWKSASLRGLGAVYEDGNAVAAFLKKEKGVDVAAFDDTQGPLDWLVINRAEGEAPAPIPAEFFCDAAGAKGSGIAATFFKGNRFSGKVLDRKDALVDFDEARDGMPEAAGGEYSVRWQGFLCPPVDGMYQFGSKAGGSCEITVDGKQVKNQSLESWIKLAAGKPVPVKISFRKSKVAGKLQLCWSVPGSGKIAAGRIFERAKRDGTTVIILSTPWGWAGPMERHTAAKCRESFTVGRNWQGGQFFNILHPLFKDLPSNRAMEWEYASIIGSVRFGMDMDGETLLAGCFQSEDMTAPGDTSLKGCRFGTAIGIVPCGKGEIIFSTLPLSPQNGVAKKILCNAIEYAAGRRSNIEVKSGTRE